jgi:hypothetical protein
MKVINKSAELICSYVNKNVNEITSSLNISFIGRPHNSTGIKALVPKLRFKCATVNWFIMIKELIASS